MHDVMDKATNSKSRAGARRMLAEAVTAVVYTSMLWRPSLCIGMA